MITPECKAELRELAAKATPRPWHACSCGKCGQVWCDDYPVAEVTRGDWGDDYPSIKLTGPSIDVRAEAVMEQITYGHVSDELANANAAYLAAAANELPSLLDDNDALRNDRDIAREERHKAEEREAVALAEVERLTAELSAALKKIDAMQDAYFQYEEPQVDGVLRAPVGKVIAELTAERDAALKRAEALQSKLMLVLDQVDYTAGNCAPNEMVGAVLARGVIAIARTALSGGAK